MLSWQWSDHVRGHAPVPPVAGHSLGTEEPAPELGWTTRDVLRCAGPTARDVALVDESWRHGPVCTGFRRTIVVAARRFAASSRLDRWPHAAEQPV